MTTAIKHISFDVWKTLITPSKEYGKARNEAIARHFGITYEEAKAAYQHCKKFLDNTAEIAGFGMSVHNNWTLLQRTLKKDTNSLQSLISECHDLFTVHKPTLNEELVIELKKLKEMGYELSIKSNTNFISGKVLSEVLFNHLDVFKFQHYSDLEECAKPGHKFYLLTEQAVKYYIHPEHILHIGDNKITDGECTKFGWNFQYVENPQDLLIKLQNQEIV